MERAPELDDDFAKDVSDLIHWKENAKLTSKNLTKEKAEDAKRAKKTLL